MYRPCFNILCSKIEQAVGETEFKSEKFIEKLRLENRQTPRSRMYFAALKTTGDYIPGEVKVGMTLRYLAGGSYLDLFLWYNSHPDHISYIVKKVTREWFCNDEVMSIDIYRDVLSNNARIQEIVKQFAKSSNGVLDGCFGAIDGWLVKILCPSLNEVPNPGRYMSRKGFFAINVQAIVDKKKEFCGDL